MTSEYDEYNARPRTRPDARPSRSSRSLRGGSSESPALGSGPSSVPRFTSKLPTSRRASASHYADDSDKASSVDTINGSAGTSSKLGSLLTTVMGVRWLRSWPLVMLVLFG
ncbi:MAG: hypothetical protein AAFO83_08645, partial [Cyanobacteria bacterium J06607_13]